jgi:hypothetical protein
MHKGFKCLDISTGRIYISRDVVFDEAVSLLPPFIPILALSFKVKLSSFLLLSVIQGMTIAMILTLLILLMCLVILVCYRKKMVSQVQVVFPAFNYF